MPEPSIPKTRPGWSIETALVDWVNLKKKETGKDASQIVSECLQKEKDNDTSDPTQVRRRQVVRELTGVVERLSALRKKISSPGTKERRFGIIARTLTNTDPHYPTGPYAKLGSDWDQIRLQSCEDLRDKPEWAKQLGIKGSLEIDEACDQAQEITRLMKLKKSLEVENAALRRKVANDKEETEESCLS